MFCMHPSSSNITRCQVPSFVRVWFNDSVDDIDFAPRQAISPVVKSHHVLGCGLMIQRMILIFIKCYSENNLKGYNNGNSHHEKTAVDRNKV